MPLTRAEQIDVVGNERQALSLQISDLVRERQHIQATAIVLITAAIASAALFFYSPVPFLVALILMLWILYLLYIFTTRIRVVEDRLNDSSISVDCLNSTLDALMKCATDSLSDFDVKWTEYLSKKDKIQSHRWCYFGKRFVDRLIWLGR